MRLCQGFAFIGDYFWYLVISGYKLVYLEAIMIHISVFPDEVQHWHTLMCHSLSGSESLGPHYH